MSSCSQAPTFFGRRHRFIRTYDTPEKTYSICVYCGEGQMESGMPTFNPPIWVPSVQAVRDLRTKGFKVTMDDRGRICDLEYDGDRATMSFDRNGKLAGISRKQRLSTKERRGRPDLAVTPSGDLIIPLIAARSLDYGFSHSNYSWDEKTVKRLSGRNGKGDETE